MKLLMVGFDGLDPSLITKFPAFNQFQQNIYLMRSVPSTFTQEAWGSMYTGRSPSEINVVATPRNLDSVSTLKGIGAQTIFEALSEAGLRIGCIGMPMTFPVNTIDAFMVAGFPLPSPQYRADEEYFHPSEIKNIIKSTYSAYLWADKEDPPIYLKDNVTYEAIEHSITQEKEKMACVTQIMEKLDCFDLDFLAIGFSFTDIAAHCRRIYPIDRAYQAADEVLQRLLETFDPENLLIISDHGLALVPWRGEPFKGYVGVPHRPYGTCICVGKDIETALKSVRRTRKIRQGISKFIQKWKNAVRFGEFRQLFDLRSPLDITDIYPLIAAVFGLNPTSKLTKQESTYSEEELESIKKRLELLGYM